MKIFAFLLAAGSLLPGTAFAQTTRLVPSPKYPTIQSAVDASGKGDTVLVAPGTYKENIDFKGKDITLKSLAGPAKTVIDGGGKAPCVTFARGETRKAVLEGFTLTGGWGKSFGYAGGITIRSLSVNVTSPTIRNCVIRGNSGRYYGGGIGGSSGSPLIEDCLIEENKALGAGYASGGGIGFMGVLAARPVVRRCIIRRNEAMARGGGAYFAYNNNAIIEDCVFTGNVTRGTTGNLDGGAAIFAALNAVCVIRNNRIYGNISNSNGGGVKIFNVSGVVLVNNTITGNKGGSVAGFANTGSFGSNVYALVVNCILWKNGPKEFAFTGKDRNGRAPYLKVSYCDVTGGYTGTGNFSSDPRLLNPGSGNHRILPTSPCWNKGTNAAPNLPSKDFEGDPRILGGTVDVGADEFNPSAAFLYSDKAVLSLSQGGKVGYSLLCGQGRAGLVYVILPSLSGTLPGTNLAGLHLPLNLDRTTWILLGGFGPRLVGNLDASGRASTSLAFPAGLPPVLAGFTLSTAAVLIDPKALLLKAATNDENLAFQ